jgi:hypothetical protein
MCLKRPRLPRTIREKIVQHNRLTIRAAGIKTLQEPSSIQQTIGIPKKQNPAKPKKAIMTHPRTGEKFCSFRERSSCMTRLNIPTASALVVVLPSHSRLHGMVGRVQTFSLILDFTASRFISLQ